MVILNILKVFFNVSFQTKYFWLRQSVNSYHSLHLNLFEVYNNFLHLKREQWLTLSVQGNHFNPRAKPRWAGRLCCSQLSYIWDLWCDHSHLQWVSIWHLLLPYWTVNISDQQLKSRCVCVMSSMHSTWNDLSLKTELWMHSRLQRYPEMFLLHSKGFCGRIQPSGSKVPDIPGKRHVQMGTSFLLNVTAERRQTTITFCTIIFPTSNLILALNSQTASPHPPKKTQKNPTFTVQSPF